MQNQPDRFAQLVNSIKLPALIGFIVGIIVILIYRHDVQQVRLFQSGSNLAWAISWIVGAIIARITNTYSFNKVSQFAIFCWYGGTVIMWAILRFVAPPSWVLNVDLILLLFLGSPVMAALILRLPQCKS